MAVAVKKSRVSLRVERTILRHEARVLQVLQGHPAIPKLFGYRRVPHFEYIAIDLLGENLSKSCKPGHALCAGTVARIADQMVSTSSLFFTPPLTTSLFPHAFVSSTLV